MKTIYTLLLALFTIIASSSYAQTSDLVKQLMEKADVSEDQAMGGAGALFGMAKEELSADDFGKISDVVPNMGGLLDAVPSLGSNKTSMLGSAAKQLTGMPKVQAVFDKLGISKEKVALFTPVIVNYVEEKGGKVLGDLLGKVFK
jgi:hypothetical protein